MPSASVRPPCENVNAIGDFHHQTHVVLDQHDCYSVPCKGANDAINLLSFDRIAARGRLIEQQQLGVAGERARDLKALERAIGQRIGRTSGFIGKPDTGERREGHFAGCRILALNRGPMHQIGQYPGILVAMVTDHHIFQHRHSGEYLQILKGPR